MADNQNLVRQRLRVALKLLLLVALGGLFVVASGQFGFESEKPVVDTMRVDLSDLLPGQIRLLDWDGRPVLVLHRTPAQIDELQNFDPDLLHVGMEENRLRSKVQEYFVTIAVGTDFGCQLEYQGVTEGKELPAHGWFEDVCRRSRYDLAGRVLVGHYARKNLVVPDYRIADQVLILGLESD